MVDPYAPLEMAAIWRMKSQETFHRCRKSVIEFIVLSAKKVKGKKKSIDLQRMAASLLSLHTYNGIHNVDVCARVEPIVTPLECLPHETDGAVLAAQVRGNFNLHLLQLKKINMLFTSSIPKLPQTG